MDFAYPMGGEVFFAGSGGDEIAASIGYVPDGDGGYAHELTVLQAGPFEESLGAGEFVGQDGWEAAQSVTYDGTERAVAIKSEADAVTFMFGFENSDGNYGIRVEVVPGTADSCPDTYASVGRRVLDSVSPRE